jgi:flagellar basal-body rod protein FlgB
MARASETRMNYETAVSLYQKSLTLLRMAARGPGA